MVKVSGAFAKAAVQRMSPEMRRQMAAIVSRKISSVGADAARARTTIASALNMQPPAIPVQDALKPRDVSKELDYSLHEGPSGKMVYTTGGTSASASGESDLGVILARRPSVVELDRGAKGEDIIFLTPSSTSSPFGKTGPSAMTLFGNDDVRARVSGSRQDQADPLYGDATDLLNRLVSGAGALGKKVVSKFDWDKMSPQTKAALGLGGVALTAYGLNKVVPNTLYLRLGKMLGDADDPSRETVMVTTPASAVERAVTAYSIPVSAESDVRSLGRTVFPLANNFMAGAYAIGKAYDNRTAQPTFGLLGGDPWLCARSLRGLRAPKMFFGDGKLVLSSAAYSVLPTSIMSPQRVCSFLQDHPLSGGIFGDMASSALQGIGDAIKGAWSTLKDWVSQLWQKVKNFFKKIFSPHTKFAARDYVENVSPIVLAAKIWSLLGKIPAAQVDAWLRAMEQDVAAIMKSDSKEDMMQRMKALLGEIEVERLKAGIPSYAPWSLPATEPLVKGQKIPGKDAQYLEKYVAADILAQYAPTTASHERDLASVGSNAWIDAMGTRNPSFMFSDQSALESDLRALKSEAETELMSRLSKQAQSDAVVLTSSPSPTSANGAAGQVLSTGATSATGVTTAAGSASHPGDPNQLAAVLATGLTRSAYDVPQAWLDQLPVGVRRGLGLGNEGDDAHFDALVGDSLPRDIDHRSLHSAHPWLTKGDAACGRPIAGAPLLVPALKFFALWVLPGLLSIIPWKSVGGWFSKNATKIKLLLSGSSANTLVANASKSGGFAASVTGACRLIASKTGAFARVLFGFMRSNPKLAAAGMILSACFVMGSSYSKDSSAFSKLVALLRAAISDLASVGVLSEAEAQLHTKALEAIEHSGPGALTEEQAQELQTIAILAYSTGQMLRKEGSSAEQRGLEGIASLEQTIDGAASDIKAVATEEEAHMLEEFVGNVIRSVNDSDGNLSSGPSLPSSIGSGGGGSQVSEASADSILGAVTAAGGTLAAARGLSKTPGGDGPAADGAVGAIPESVHAQVGTAAGEGDESSATFSVDNLTDQQVDDVQTMVDAASNMTMDELVAEESGYPGAVSKSVSELIQKWGLPAAAAGAVTALVVKAALARKRGAAARAESSGAVDGSTAASKWWESVARRLDPSAAGYDNDGRTLVAV